MLLQKCNNVCSNFQSFSDRKALIFEYNSNGNKQFQLIQTCKDFKEVYEGWKQCQPKEVMGVLKISKNHISLTAVALQKLPDQFEKMQLELSITELYSTWIAIDILTSVGTRAGLEGVTEGLGNIVNLVDLTIESTIEK